MILITDFVDVKRLVCTKEEYFSFSFTIRVVSST